MNQLESAAERTIKEYFNQLNSSSFQLSKIIRQDYHFEFEVSKNKEKVKVLVYFGKKGIKTVLQGDKSSKLYIELYNKFNTDLFGIDKEEVVEPEKYIGTDESGKGDYFGPLVIAGVLIDDTNREYLQHIGVRDSKELSDTMIGRVAREIKRIEGIKFNIISIYPKKYNELYLRLGNVNRILGWAHAKVIENLLDKTSVEEAISDKFGDDKYIFTSLQEKGKNITLHQVTKAERFKGVAAASILARDRFNSWFKHEKQKLGFELPKGASEACEAASQKIIEKIGRHSLGDFAKLHFKNTKRIDENL